ncbi:hypothetical protein C0J52_13919 [Blattella germanica]|nr:hypothetical protein C0J52_13919 [Blattella germanica]
MSKIEDLIDSLSDGVELLQRSLQCSICLEILKDPACTRCSHTFCRSCIMTVINTHRIAHCPLCNKSINRRGISANQKIGLLLEKVQKVIEGIGKDTGFDITAHAKLPSSTKEAYLASPKFVKGKGETTVKPLNSPQVFVEPAVPATKDQWLKRYEKQYQAKQNVDDVDLLSISQAETNIASYFPKDRKLLAAKKKVDKINLPTAVKVEEWLQKNENEFDEEPLSPLTITPESQKQPCTLTVSADVHQSLEDDPDLLSVSQQQFYIAPRKTDVEILKSSSDDYTNSVSVKNSIEKIFPTKASDLNKEKNKEKVEIIESNPVADPYEFVSSQKTCKETNGKRKSRSKGISKKKENPPRIVQKYETYLKKSCDKKNKKNENVENKVEFQSQAQSETTFICPIEVNNTFDNLVFDVRGHSENNKVKLNEKLDPPKPTNVISQEDDGEDGLFRTPLQTAIIFRNHDDESTTESMSDMDFSSDSNEEWADTNKAKVNNKRLRIESDTRCKKVFTKKGNQRKTLPASNTTNERLSTQKTDTDTKKPDTVPISAENIETRKVMTFEKKTPLSPSKKINCKMENRTSSLPYASDDSKEKLRKNITETKNMEITCINKENISEPSVEPSALQNISNVNTVVSRSPGWSRITQTKKDFEKLKKPMLKALDVSGGEACLTKKYSLNDANKEIVRSTVISPIPTIDDAETNVSAMSTYPVVAFNSPEAMNRARAMSKLVKNLEKEIGPSTSIIGEGMCVNLGGTNTGVASLQKCVSFTSTFSAPLGEESPTANKRKEQITNIISSLDEDNDSCSKNDNTTLDKVTEVIQEDVSCAKTILDVIDSSKKNITKEPKRMSPKETEIHENNVKEPDLSKNSEVCVESNEKNKDQEQLCNAKVMSVVVVPESETNTEDLDKRETSETCTDHIGKARTSVTDPDKHISPGVLPLEEEMQIELAATDVQKESAKMMESSCKTDSNISQTSNNFSHTNPLTTENKMANNLSKFVHEARSNTSFHVPFIKFGALRCCTKYVNVRFVQLGSLVMKTKESYGSYSQETSCSATLNLEFSRPIEPSKPEFKCIGVQTSPTVGECLSAYGTLIRGNDAKSLTTPTTNPNFVQFTTPLWTADSENFVPDSMGEGECMFQSTIPLPQRSALWDIPPAFEKSSQVENGFMSPVYTVVEPLSCAQKSSNEKNDSPKRNQDNMAETFKKPRKSEDLGLPISQFSTATTIKISRPKTTDTELERTSTSPPDSMECDHSVSLLKESQSLDNDDKADFENKSLSNSVSLQGELSPNDKNSEHKKESSSITYEDNLRNLSNRSSSVVPSRRSSRASRQLKFSPYSVPKLTDPALNRSMEDEERSNTSSRNIKNTQNKNSQSSSECRSILNIKRNSSNEQCTERKSYKRIRTASTSSDSDLTDSERTTNSKRKNTRKSRSSIKKIKSNDDMTEENDTEEVIDLLSPSDNASNSIIPGTFEKENFEEWLNKDVPNSEELIEKMMANIDSDLVQTRERKLREKAIKALNESKEERPESPAIFTPSQPTVAKEAESEEASNKFTCELVISQPDEKKDMSKTFNTAEETDTENLCTQKAQAGICVLEAQIKKCQDALKQAEIEENQTCVSVLIESDESEEDYVKPTPKKDEVTDKTWGGRSRELVAQGNKPSNNCLEKQIVPLENCTKTFVGPNRRNAGEDDRRKKEETEPSTVLSPSTQASPNKQFFHQPPMAATVQERKTPQTINNTKAASEIQREIAPISSTEKELPAQVPSKLCFVCSGLPMGLIARVKALTRILGAEFSNKFEPHTTHLVVKASDDMMADKTYKYLSAVARRKWVVSIAWVNACLQARKLVPEDDYEMLDSSGENGPHRSRMSSQQLFKNFEFCCIEPFTDLTRDQLEDILTVCGARTVNSPDKFTFKQHSMILIQMDSEKEEEYKELWKTYGVLPIGHEWVFECIGRFRIMPIWSFLMFDISQDDIETLGYPEDALASDEENEMESDLGSRPG